MKRSILLLTLGAALFSCSAKKSVLSNEYVQGAAYTGTLPCTDCDGISQVVILDSNNTFRLSETYLGKEDTCQEKGGSWALTDGKITLYSGQNTIAQYAIAGNRLVYLEEAGFSARQLKKQVGQGMLARKNYKPSKKIDPDFLQGIDIIAFGAEPSWSLDIHHKRAIQFSIPGLDAPVAFSTVEPVLSGDSIIYNIEGANDRMRVVLSPGFCTDGVGNNLYDYKVTVSYKGKAYNGCGAVINADGSLTGAWLLDDLIGETLNWENQPYIVVDLENEKFYGNTGCNDFSGSARMRGPSICFSDIKFESQRDCNAYDENLLIETLIQCNGFTINEGRLDMSKDARPLISFRRHIPGSE